MPQVTIKDALQLAQEHRNAGRLREAETIYREIIAQRPDHAESHHQLGLLSHQEGKHAIAIDSFLRAIAVRPGAWHFHTNLGAAHAALDQWDDAVTAYRKALELRADRAETHNNLGMAYRELDQLDDALTSLQKAITLDPDRAEYHTNLGAVLEKLGRFDNAIAAHRKAIRINPHFAEAHFNLATDLLATSQFAEGWREYEWRWKCKGFQTQPSPYSQPRWDGSDLTGRTILLYSEQGLGDSIHFARYAPLVAARGARVILGCPPTLEPLLKTVYGIGQVVSEGKKLRPFDLQISLMSLPAVFGTTLDTIPAQIPYISADPVRREFWREKLSMRAGTFKVGLAWAGHPDNRNDRRRSIPLRAFEPLADVPRVTYYSLQKGNAAKQIEDSNLPIIDHTADLHDFADTAALVINLDLVISVDTGVAHLTGALGKPAWTLLPFAPDWRWLLGREDTPWYPTMRLFRQPTAGDWASVMTCVANELVGAVLTSSHDVARHSDSPPNGR